MLVANIAKDIFSLLTNATETWRSLATEPADKKRADLFLRNFYYPLLVIVGVAVLIGSLWNNDGMALDLAMRKMSLTLMVLFGSFFLSSLILNKGAERWFGQTDNMARAEIFTGYSLSIYYALTLIMAEVYDSHHRLHHLRGEPHVLRPARIEAAAVHGDALRRLHRDALGAREDAAVTYAGAVVIYKAAQPSPCRLIALRRIPVEHQSD
jgi:hypothetical protein